MSALHEQLASDGLLQIGAATAHAQLDSLAQQAAVHHWSYSHFLGRLLEAELAARRQRVIETSLHFSGLPWQKRPADFDFSFQPSIDRALIEELATGRFLDEGRNVIFQGPPGVGKTHVAIALGLACAERGQRLLFLGAMELARRMKTAFSANRMPHYMKMLTTPKLLIVDEVGYLGLDHDQASLLFQVICQRYEKKGRHHHHLQKSLQRLGPRLRWLRRPARRTRKRRCPLKDQITLLSSRGGGSILDGHRWVKSKRALTERSDSLTCARRGLLLHAQN
jgi:DNA replication protein DnaC